MASPHPVFSARELAVLRDPSRWRVAATALGSEVPAIARDDARGWRRSSRHAHPGCEILIALDGDVGYGHPLGVLRCRRGACLVFDAFEPHDDGYPFAWPASRRAPSDLVMRHLWLSVVGDRVFPHLFSARGGLARHDDVLTRPLSTGEIGVDLPRIAAACRELGARAAIDARAMLVGAIAVACAAILARSADAAPEAEADPAIARVRRHLDRTAGADASLRSLAALAGCSRFHLARRFRALVGCSIGDYVDARRLEVVRRLRGEGAGLAAAASALGFSSASALSRWCRRRGVGWRS